jgi:hypothetical protein
MMKDERPGHFRSFFFHHAFPIFPAQNARHAPDINPHDRAFPCHFAPISKAQTGASRYKTGRLKSIRFIPLAFLAGVHGFALFAPYVLIFVALMMILQRTRPVPVTVPA